MHQQVINLSKQGEQRIRDELDDKRKQSRALRDKDERSLWRENLDAFEIEYRVSSRFFSQSFLTDNWRCVQSCSSWRRAVHDLL